MKVRCQFLLPSGGPASLFPVFSLRVHRLGKIPCSKEWGIFSSNPPHKRNGRQRTGAPCPSASGTQDTPAAPVPSLVPRSELQRNAGPASGAASSLAAPATAGAPPPLFGHSGGFLRRGPCPCAAPCGPGPPAAAPPGIPPAFSPARHRPRFAAGSCRACYPCSPAVPSAPLRAPAACALVALALLRVGFGLRRGRRVPPARPLRASGGSFLAGGQAAASGGSDGFAPRLFAAFGRCSQRALLRLSRPCGQCCA